jgi:fumarylacetoacetate (FAA) hydrolase
MLRQHWRSERRAIKPLPGPWQRGQRMAWVLLAHAAYSRDLVAGTVIGSGTVSNEDYRVVGSSCIAERRAIELLDEGQPRTPYLAFGDRVRMLAVREDGRDGPFGVIDQQVVQSAGN